MGLDLKVFFTVIITYFVSLPSIVGMFGIGLIVGGIALIEKNLGQFVYIIQTGILLISNAVIPTETFISRLLPFSYGIDIVRNLYMGNGWDIKIIFRYFMLNIIWIIMGTRIFNHLLKKEKRFGAFNSY